MPWPTPQFSRSQVSKAGRVLANGVGNEPAALDVVSNWRSCHGYPMNTFQATLRRKLESIDSNALVAQRLKRTPSIVQKLRRFDRMRLTQMQDIGGLRAVMRDLKKVRKLGLQYRINSRFKHELVSEDDYILRPQESGYRSLHLVYRYNNPRASDYNGLLIELQFRTRLQHNWATAVETVSLFLGQALKSSEGSSDWLKFFAVVGSAFAALEDTEPVPGYEHLKPRETFREVRRISRRLKVAEKLRGFSMAAKAVQGTGDSYYLIVLDVALKTVSVITFPRGGLNFATDAYNRAEKQIQDGQPIHAVLVSTESISALRRAYPSYFLDTTQFVRNLEDIESRA